MLARRLSPSGSSTSARYTRRRPARENDPTSAVPQHPTHPNDAQASRHASNDLRHSGTPETPVVRDLVRTHTSPGRITGPQA